MTDLNLFCLVDGHPTSKAFLVKTPSTETVAHLKKLISVEKASEFDEITPDNLTLWSVSIPIAGDDGIPTIVDTLTEKNELSPAVRLLKLFPDNLPEATIQVFVQKPPAASELLKGSFIVDLGVNINGVTNKSFAACDVATSYSSMVLFAMHQLLYVFGRGTHTAIAAAPNKDGSISLSTFAHGDQDQTCIHAIKSIEAVSSQSASDHLLRISRPQELQAHLFDACFTYFSTSSPRLDFPCPFLLVAHDDDESMFSLQYDAAIFEQEVAARFLGVFSVLLTQFTIPTTPIRDLEYISPLQMSQLETWNRTDGPYPDKKLIHQLIEEAAERTPHKSEILILTILGIWKAGSIYIPIDQSYPDERVRFTLQDTLANVMLSSQRHITRLEKHVLPAVDHPVRLLAVESIFAMLMMDDSVLGNNLDLDLKSSHVAYMTYTSGTTGVPKGIHKEHRSIVNSITDLSVRYGVADGQEPEVILLFAAYVFEPFVRQTLMALVNSQTLAVIDDIEKLDSQNLQAFVQKHKVTYLNGTASVLREFDFSDCPSLKRLILVGEDLTETRYMELRRKFKNRIFNDQCLRARIDQDKSLFGKTILQPPCQISSLGMNGLIYKTGDLARWLQNGEIEYLGRNDFQIKLRGIRIEPGEIETVLSHYPGVRTSVVVATDRCSSASKHLIGYYVSETGEDISEEALLQYLETKLPPYMVPTALVQLSAIPVTVNGKADFRALPDVDLSQRGSAMSLALRTELDRTLRRIWSETLGIPLCTIGVDSNFFRLGGHSITCIQLVARIRRAIQVEVTAKDIFIAKTLGALSDLLELRISDKDVGNLVQEDMKESDIPILSLPVSESGNSIEAFYLANSLQQGFVYHYLKQSHADDTFVMRSVLIYSTNIEPELYKAAWQSAQTKYPSLRMRFAWENEVLQIIDKSQTLDWRFTDLTRENYGEEDAIHMIQEMDRRENYVLNSGSLFRVHFLRVNNERSLCLFSCHHAILDGWSLPILYEYVNQTYLKLLLGGDMPISTDTAYCQAQSYLQSHRGNHVNFWAAQINDIKDRCDLNTLLNEVSRYKVPLGSYDNIREEQEMTLMVENAWTADLKEACASNGITLHSILQFVWHAILHVYGGGSHTVTGTIISGRNLPVDDIECSVGLFINTLPLVVNHIAHEGGSILEAITAVQYRTNEINSRSNVELGHIQMLQGELKHGLFDTLFVLENYPNLNTSAARLAKEKLSFEIRNESEKLDYPLAVIAREVEAKQGFTFTIRYAGELFENTTIEDILQMVREIFLQISANPNMSVADLEFIARSQQQRLNAWNANEAAYPEDATLNELFERETCRVPDKVAVVYEDTRVTYRDLNERANRLASHIRTCLSKYPGQQLVALFMDKSERMILSILAVWKAGAGYVPIDPSYPEDRVTFILEDTAAKMVISDQQYAERLIAMTGNNLNVLVSESADELCRDFSGENLLRNVSSTDLAYIIYTSGTTGKPKGVMIEHQGVVNLQVSLAKIFSLQETEDEVILSFSNYVFDHFVEQMTDAILNGQTLVMLNDAMRADKERLYKYISDNKVTYLSGTPSVISLYEYDRFASHLRRVDCVGEAFSEPVFNKIRNTFGGLIINGYGPTEISITSHKRLYPVNERRNDKSIGKQVANTTSYVLDENLKRVPIGAVGELFIGGDGVARGYHNRPDLTEQRFLVNPFQTSEEKKQGKNTRMYRTGDLVRWLPNSDGEIEYLGRNDFQVKIRGLRIELGEIETVLSNYPGISRSVVVAKDVEQSTGQKYLIGYYVSDGTLLEREIKKYMGSKLPDYMVPNRLVPVALIPVTISGKLDTKSLPAAEFSGNDEYMAPENEIEMILCDIWSELLGIPADRIGTHDDFFMLGGDSLMSTRLSFMVTSQFGRQVTVATLFKCKTIKTLCQFVLSGSDDSQETEIVPLTTLGDVPISLSQERIMFINEMESGTDAYNIAINLEFTQSAKKESLKQAFRSIVIRHKVLRTLLTRWQHGASTHLQHLLEASSVETMLSIAENTVQDVAELDQRLNDASRYIFDLESELPIKIDMYNVLASETFYVSIVIHHVAFDAWSWSIFKRDLVVFYGLHEGIATTLSLPQLEIGYAEYAQWQRNALDKGLHSKRLREFWAQKLGGFEQLHLTTDMPRPRHFDYIGSDLQFELEEATTQGLKRLAQELKVSLYSLMAAVYVLLLSVYTGQDDVVIGVPVSNRNRPELENIVGFFVNMVVLRVKVNSESSFKDYILGVHRELIDAQLHQEMPFQEVVKELSIANDPSRHPIIQAIFNLERPLVDCQESVLAMKNYIPNASGWTSAKFDLSATMIEEGSALRGNFNYAAAMFSEGTVEGWIRTFKILLEQVASGDGAARKISELNLSGRESYDELPWSCFTPESRSGVETLHTLFEQNARISSDKLAIVFGEKRLTYRELNERANQLARHLKRTVYVKPDDLVALVLDKSDLMVLSLLAVWKAGAAYVPIDPGYPNERIDFILRDTGAKALIINNKYSERMKGIAKETAVIAIDASSTMSALDSESATNLDSGAVTTNLAYVIYTSGTTGRPKGVLVQHEGVVNFRNSIVSRYFGSSSDLQEGVLLLSNYVFDFSMEQLCLSILSSNKLLIPSGDLTIDDAFYDFCNTNGLTYISSTPTVLQQIDLSRLYHLQMMTCAGEELTNHHFGKFRKDFRGPLNNAYGVTETIVYNTVSTFDGSADFENSLGMLLPNMRGYVLNGSLQLLPRGAVGELYLAGDCVAKGYLNRPELTHERFLPNPFDGAADGLFGRMYKTGDLVRHHQDGRLEYFECAVIAKYDDEISPQSRQAKCLVGYFVPQSDMVREDHIEASLRARLPYYMVPTSLVRITDKLPVTVNGKLDEKALPE
ncbi:hypothetical protein BGZ65_008339, partial [Modicella reniformis]